MSEMAALPYFAHVIDGAEEYALDGARFDSIDPRTRKPWAQVALGGERDADRAVAS